MNKEMCYPVSYGTMVVEIPGIVLHFQFQLHTHAINAAMVTILLSVLYLADLIDIIYYVWTDLTGHPWVGRLKPTWQ